MTMYSDSEGEYTPPNSRINLDNMKSVMHGERNHAQEITEIRAFLEKLSKSHNNLIRENQTLRKRNTNLENRNRNLENRLSNVERTQESLSYAVNELVNILDNDNKSGIIGNKRRK